MTSSLAVFNWMKMAKYQYIFEEDCYQDRISYLPRKVIDRIMEFLPVRDATRTCVLSKKWRNVWADHPSLVLDKGFWDGISTKHNHNAFIEQLRELTTKLRLDYPDIVSNILLNHTGYIRKFIIDVSVINSLPGFKMDLWLSIVCRRGVQELSLENSNHNHLYKVPCCVFSTSELTYLSLSHCIVKGKDTSVRLTNIQSLILEDVALQGSMVLDTPLLTSLTLERCCGVRDFNISAPGLASLILRENDYLDLKPFLTCKGINDALVYSVEKIECPSDSERINLVELFAAWPGISKLVVDGFCFKYLATDVIPDHTLQLNLRVFELMEMALDAEVIAWILCILKNSPLLHTFEIWFSTTDSEGVNGVVDEPSIVDYRIEQLCTIKMKDFSASKIEVMLAKMLLQCVTVPVKMLIEENTRLDPNEQVKILKNLLVLQQASPKVQIVFRPGLVLP